MNLLNIFNHIQEQDPEFYDRVSPRRKVIAGLSRRVALTALPFALGSMLKKAYGQTNDILVSTLNFALKLEYLEVELYTQGLAASGLVPVADRNAVQLLLTNESGHVTFVKNTIVSLGGVPDAKPTYDLTGGNGNGNGPFKNYDTDYDIFLALAQSSEMLGLRAYKGAAGNLASNNAVLEGALRIHSVEARHEAKVRMMRAARGAAVKPWVTLDQSGITNVTVSADPYEGEAQTRQPDAITGYQLAGLILPGAITITANAASEAFDEPLTPQDVTTILDGFLV